MRGTRAKVLRKLEATMWKKDLELRKRYTPRQMYRSMKRMWVRSRGVWLKSAAL